MKYLDYINGTFEIKAPFTDKDGEHESERAWYRLEPENQYNDLLITLKNVNTYFKENGPFDGVLGFSQGSMLIHVLNNIMESEQSINVIIY